MHSEGIAYYLWAKGNEFCHDERIKTHPRLFKRLRLHCSLHWGYQRGYHMVRAQSLLLEICLFCFFCGGVGFSSFLRKCTHSHRIFLTSSLSHTGWLYNRNRKKKAVVCCKNPSDWLFFTATLEELHSQLRHSFTTAWEQLWESQPEQ